MTWDGSADYYYVKVTEENTGTNNCIGGKKTNETEVSGLKVQQLLQKSVLLSSTTIFGLLHIKKETILCRRLYTY